jgi:hypothetical protein
MINARVLECAYIFKGGEVWATDCGIDFWGVNTGQIPGCGSRVDVLVVKISQSLCDWVSRHFGLVSCRIREYEQELHSTAALDKDSTRIQKFTGHCATYPREEQQPFSCWKYCHAWELGIGAYVVG